jgi:hypothetical protein
MLTPEQQSREPEQNPFTDLLLGRSIGWDAIVGKPFAEERLCINRSASNALLLEWRSTTALRPKTESPMLIEFVVPEGEITETVPSDFKSRILTDFLSSGAGQAVEPLRSAFFEELRERGYTVKSITNGTFAHELQKKFDANAAALHNCEIISGL